MEKVVRFGVSMEKVLLKDFDKLIEKRGYSSRSEALRDLLRSALISEVKLDPNANIFATVSILYKHSEHHLSDVLADIQHKNHSIVISTTHIHLDCDNCLEVVMLKGKASKVKELAETLISVKGVRHGGVVYSAK
ncbi:MAG: nickel-responsive transcriptional regulator NikR [Thermoanaerobaculaceae bacterium]|nr:nickel-responsive transcriptional regulator NikR [Thermoanaerobaculaceae bacterium]